MEILWLLTIVFLSLLALLIFLTNKDVKYFSSRGIQYLGNMSYSMIFHNLNYAENTLYWYKKARSQNLKMAGFKELFGPSIMVTDPELIKQICMKDFEHFGDHGPFKFSKRDYIIKNSLLMSTGNRWKFLRSKVSPTLSPGKIRRMFEIFETNSTQLVSYLEKETANFKEIDIADGFVKYTTNVVASAAFGFDSKAFAQKEASKFQEMGQALDIKCKGPEIAKLLFMQIVPQKISDFLGLSAFSFEAQTYLSGIVRSELNRRKESGDKRQDFLQMMIDAKEKEDFETQKNGMNSNEFRFQEDDIISLCVSFMFSGWDATTSNLNFFAYVLALNRDVQDQLFQEISNSLEETGGEFTYESVTQMKYMDMVMNETLRLYSPFPITNRICTKQYKIPDSNVVVKKNEIIFIPLFGMHRDPEYFEDPDRFDPERWSAENHSKIQPYSFLAFGLGLRSCPGYRFAQTEIKLAMAHLVHNFIFEPCDKTLIPMKFGSSVTVRPRDGMWINLIKRP